MRSSQSFGIYFTLRTDKTKNGQAPLYVAITVNKAKCFIALKHMVDLDIWDTGSGKARGNRGIAKELNAYLEEVRIALGGIYKDLQVRSELITVQLIKNKFLGEEEYAHTLNKLMAYHNETASTSLGAATMRHYLVSQRYLGRFLKEKYQLEDIALNEIDFQFIQDFDNYLRHFKPVDHQKPLSNNGVMVHLIRLKKMIHMAHNLEWIPKDPFSNYKLRMKRVNKEFLSEAELLRVEQKEFEIASVDMIRDLFVFCCYTGLSYIDLMQLRPEHISKAEDGQMWIRTKREKTEFPVVVPLVNEALVLLKKYRKNPRANYNGTVFPVISNQKVNLYLKEVSKLCGINKNLTFHMARHTFATTVALSNGVPIETVSKILGHSKIATTQIYARVLEKKMKEDMKSLQQRLAVKKKSQKLN